MGLRTSDVNERYKKAGLGVEGGEMPDYISHECEFVSILSGREVAGLLEEGNIKMQRNTRRCAMNFCATISCSGVRSFARIYWHWQNQIL